ALPISLADTGSMVVVLVLLPFVARAIKRLGSRTAMWAAAVPYLAGFALLLLWAQAWWHVLLCYLLIMTGRYTVSTSTTALDAALIDAHARETELRNARALASVRALLTAPRAGVQMGLYMP